MKAWIACLVLLLSPSLYSAAIYDDYRILNSGKRLRPEMPDQVPDNVVQFDPRMIESSRHFLHYMRMVVWLNTAPAPSLQVKKADLDRHGQQRVDKWGRPMWKIETIYNHFNGEQTAMIWLNGEPVTQFGEIIGSSGNPKLGKGAQASPTGWFVGERVEGPNYVSENYGWPMPNVVFFKDGAGAHELPALTENEMGSPNSHGCFRLPPAVAKFIRDDMAQYIDGTDSFLSTTYVPMFTRSGHPIRDATGQIRMSDTMTDRESEDASDHEAKRALNAAADEFNAKNAERIKNGEVAAQKHVNGRYFPVAFILENRPEGVDFAYGSRRKFKQDSE